MALSFARFVNLLLASTLTGNEVGTLVAIHPALRTLPMPAQVEAEQAVTRRYGAIMPALMTSVIASCFPTLRLTRGRESAACTLAGAVCYAVMLGVTLLGNVPLNRQTLQASPQSPPADWLDLRARWERFHMLRVLLDLTGWSLLCLAALAKSAASNEQE